MTDVPILLALAAGVVAAVNPCGFALLPAYLSLLVAADGSASRGAAVRRALALTAAMTVGFVAVFGAFGLVLVPAASMIQRHLPWFTIGLGLLLTALGGWLVAGRALPALPWKVSRAPALTGSWASMALFGAAYALASLSCTVGPFLAIVGSSLRAGSAVAGIGLFVAYALGMGLVVGTLALGVALARASLARRLRAAAAGLSRVAGALLLITGGYVAYYGRYELHAGTRGGAPDRIVRAGTALQQALATGLDRLGVPAIAAVFAVLLVGAVAAARLSGRRPSRGSAPVREEGAPLTE